MVRFVDLVSPVDSSVHCSFLTFTGSSMASNSLPHAESSPFSYLASSLCDEGVAIRGPVHSRQQLDDRGFAKSTKKCQKDSKDLVFHGYSIERAS
jgi:hypothetical protein